jgi:PadR family transcriptional regulator, regulatory protein PadR
MNYTLPTALVVQAVASGHHHGFDIMDATDLPSGTVYPALRRLEDERLVRSRWEKPERAQREGRPPRRYYELTAAGEAWLAQARERFRRLASLAPSPRGLRPVRSES